ncbi:MAG TPA: hypothetical protein VKP11_01920 [Frankiaceae bacterium]|nr:hypothetical protein [Frankiaceae bacterium]
MEKRFDHICQPVVLQVLTTALGCQPATVEATANGQSIDPTEATQLPGQPMRVSRRPQRACLLWVGGGLCGVVWWGRLGRGLVPDGLGEIVEPLVPPQAERPQGGGARYVDHRAVFTAVVDVLRAGGAGRRSLACPRRRPPAVRRLDRGRGVAPAAPGGAGPARRAGGQRLVPGGGAGGQRAGAKRAALTGPNPVECGTPGAHRHLLTDRSGRPLAVPVRAAHTHDSLALSPLVQAIPAIRSAPPAAAPTRQPARRHRRRL